MEKENTEIGKTKSTTKLKCTKKDWNLNELGKEKDSFLYNYMLLNIVWNKCMVHASLDIGKGIADGNESLCLDSGFRPCVMNRKNSNILTNAVFFRKFH